MGTVIDKKNELVKAALLIYEHCEKNKCNTCPFFRRNPDEPDDTYSFGDCRLDASCPSYWDVDEREESCNE